MIWQTILILTILIEALTIFGRFIFKISSKEILHKIMHHFHWKKVVHFHHGFMGIIITATAVILKNNFIICIGISMILSDAIHHFIVLKKIVGDPEFHVIYKNLKDFEKEEKLEDKKIKAFFRRKK